MIESNETLFQLYGSASWIWACAGAVLIWMELLWMKLCGLDSKAVLWWNLALIPCCIFICGGYMAADYLGFGNSFTNIFCGALWVGIVAMKCFRVQQWRELREINQRLKELKGE